MSDWLGIAAVALAVCLGVGGCDMMHQNGQAALLKAQRETAPQCSTP
jgi:hypothetical protein